MTVIKKVFEYQLWHLLALILLILSMSAYLYNDSNILNGSFLHIPTSRWFYLAILIPIIHQVYVWLVWRFELYASVFSKRIGVKSAFTLYAMGFSFLFVSRLISIIFLALSSQDSLHINPIFAYLLAALITPLVIFLFYSVKMYFTVERAYGIDHFDKHYNTPYVKKGIFKYTDNGMYVFGLMILYLPGLLLLSKAALIVALFNHLYIWVHYYCTERPDMQEIYGKAP